MAQQPASDSVVSSTVVTQSSATVPRPSISMSPAPQPLQPLVDHITDTYGGTAAIALFDGTTPRIGGNDQALPAWSTIKVPIAIAALHADPGLAGTAAAAIRTSDNAAAQTLWDTVGPDAVNSVLASGGSETIVNTEPIRPEFSTFGQTAWTVSDQAQFAYRLPEFAAASPVLEYMGSVDPSQSYGLGQLPGAYFKGGWGPDLSGNYLVRQFGFVEIVGHRVGVAIAASAGDGTYATGQQMLSALVRDVASLLGAESVAEPEPVPDVGNVEETPLPPALPLAPLLGEGDSRGPLAL
ncbi:serine hydrolase [Corynebacterium renale]|uniref:serine hydrolase n=1 Tax=Corynebacterium renale TaxID=1724 RepID=UPI001E6297AC|nr:serine hydrolase [Corynebacterium renale]